MTTAPFLAAAAVGGIPLDPAGPRILLLLWRRGNFWGIRRKEEVFALVEKEEEEGGASGGEQRLLVISRESIDDDDDDYEYYCSLSLSRIIQFWRREKVRYKIGRAHV